MEWGERDGSSLLVRRVLICIREKEMRVLRSELGSALHSPQKRYHFCCPPHPREKDGRDEIIMLTSHMCGMCTSQSSSPVQYSSSPHTHQFLSRLPFPSSPAAGDASPFLVPPLTHSHSPHSDRKKVSHHKKVLSSSFSTRAWRQNGGGLPPKRAVLFFCCFLDVYQDTYEVESWNSGDFKMDSQLGWHCWVSLSLSLLSFCRLVRCLGYLLCPPDPTPKNTTSWALAFGLAAISLWAYTLKFLLQLFFMLFLLSPSFSLSAWHHRRHQRRKKDILRRKAKNMSKKTGLRTTTIHPSSLSFFPPSHNLLGSCFKKEASLFQIYYYYYKLLPIFVSFADFERVSFCIFL